MDAERSRRVFELFEEVVELARDERAVALDAACGHDSALRGEVEALLVAHEEAAEFLEHPPGVAAVAEAEADGLVGSRIGQYSLERVLSSGGMGTVYEATQRNPRRTVAVKVMHGAVTSDSALRRFEHESQILGTLRHPGIAQVFEAGTQKRGSAGASLPYFVMELVPEARTITEYARDEGLATNERLRLFTQVCAAIHHGHLKGIVHRDIKPANILVDPTGSVKVIDFGVARATDSDLALTTVRTEVGHLVGTVQYMSPEQCRADPDDLDLRSDVYALGVVLYELLCARLPYDLRGLPVVEAVRRIREDRPVRPSTSVRGLRGDLETIVLKALDKDRERRYQSADALRCDIDRYLAKEPIAARPPSVVYRLRTFARRNKALVGGVAGIFVALVTGVVASTWLYVEATREAESARTINEFFSEMLSSVDPVELHIGSGFEPRAVPAAGRTYARSRDLSVAEMMRWAVPRIGETFAGKPAREALARESVGMTLFGLGLYAEARPQLQTALALRAEVRGEDHPDTLRSKIQLGNLLWVTGEYAAAERILRPAVEPVRRVFGEESRHALCCATILAAVISYQGGLEEGDQLFGTTLAKQRRALSEESPYTLWTMLEWAFELTRRSELRRAEALVSRALDISDRALGPEHFLTAAAQSSQGWLCVERGEYPRAEGLLRRALRNRQQALGEAHPRTLLVQFILGRSLCGAEQLEERLQLYREGLSGLRAALGPGHHWTGVGTMLLADTLAENGRHAELEELLRQRLESCRETLGPFDPATIAALEQLASFLLERDRRAEGAELLGNAVGRAVQALGEEHRLTLRIESLASGALFHAGELDGARAYASRAIAGWRRRVSAGEASSRDFNGLAWLLLTCEPAGLRDSRAALALAEKAVELSGESDAAALDTLALAYDSLGETQKALEAQEQAIGALPPMRLDQRRPYEDSWLGYLLRCGGVEEAERFLDERMRKYRETCGETALILGGALFEDALLLAEHGQHDLAEPRARACLEIERRGAAGDPSTSLARATALLGHCLAESGSYQEAEPLLRDGYAHLERRPLAVAERGQVLRWLATLYEDWGRPDEAARFRALLQR